jgi:hypothetical protein
LARRGRLVEDARGLAEGAGQPAHQDLAEVLATAHVEHRARRLAHERVGDVEHIVDAALHLAEEAGLGRLEKARLEIALGRRGAYRGDALEA